MTQLIDVAKRYGIAELVGEVLRENRPMLDLCRALGFEIATNPDDSLSLRVRKPLVVP
jgi:acetyltransferase